MLFNTVICVVNEDSKILTTISIHHSTNSSLLYSKLESMVNNSLLTGGFLYLTDLSILIHNGMRDFTGYLIYQLKKENTTENEVYIVPSPMLTFNMTRLHNYYSKNKVSNLYLIKPNDQRIELTAIIL